jgi:hypothetical protein
MSFALRMRETPAAAAAKVLIWLGLCVLFLGLPCAGVFWRGAIYVLFPVGGMLVLTGALLDAPPRPAQRLSGALASPAGLAALFLAFWTGLSLLWTPFPADAGQRFLQAFAAASLAALAAIYLPHRTKTSELYLLPAGLALSSGAILLLAYFDPPWFFGAFSFDETLFERAMITAIVLVWPALGFLSLRENWISAALLAALAAAVALAGFAQIALLAMGAGALAFAVSMSGPAKTGRILGWVFAVLILLAPLLPFLYRLVLRVTGETPGLEAAPLVIWGDLAAAQWTRLITGHGFEFVHHGLSLGYLPPGTPRSLLFVLWYDLGLAGAAGLAVLLLRAFKGAGGLPASVAPAVIAGLVTVLTIATLGIATSQIWWLTLLNCDAVAFTFLVKSADKARRPGIEAIRAMDQAL